jgi:hypothetical protein
MPPKVFVSHASEDKERFVIPFATKLREKGIDAWLDRWEMKPGDSLVDKIFEAGLKEATAVIVVISSVSVTKPWVREELNAALVKRIDTGSKLIPVVIDKCEVPEALKSIVWEVVKNLDSIDGNVDSIVSAIRGKTSAPPIGPDPTYIEQASTSIAELTPLDSLILKTACEIALFQGDMLIEPEESDQQWSVLGLSKSQIEESLQVLEHRGFIKIASTMGHAVHHFLVTPAGFESFAQKCVSAYDDVFREVVTGLVNEKLQTNLQFAEETKQPRLLIDHIFDVLESAGHIKQSRYANYDRDVYFVNASLRRIAAQWPGNA